MTGPMALASTLKEPALQTLKLWQEFILQSQSSATTTVKTKIFKTDAYP